MKKSRAKKDPVKKAGASPRSTKRPSRAAPNPDNTVAFQGLPGAYSDLACREVFPKMATLPTDTFVETYAAVEEGRARLAMIPIENSVAGRVADIHHLIPRQKLHIIGEHFQRVEHHLLAVPGATLKTLKTVQSHVQALDQCRKSTKALGLRRVVGADTAGSAAEGKVCSELCCSRRRAKWASPRRVR